MKQSSAKGRAAGRVAICNGGTDGAGPALSFRGTTLPLEKAHAAEDYTYVGSVCGADPGFGSGSRSE